MIKTRFSDSSKSRQQGAILLSAIIVTFVISMLAGSYLYLSSGGAGWLGWGDYCVATLFVVSAGGDGVSL